MNNHEKYRKAYDLIQPSEGFTVDLNQKPVRRRHFSGNVVAAAMLVAVLTFSCVGTAYAADFMGLRTKVTTWLGGTETETTIIAREDGSYRITYEDAQGCASEIYSDGDGITNDPAELTEQLIQELNAPQLEQNEDERLILFWGDLEDDITDEFEDGVCYHAMTFRGKTAYVTLVKTAENAVYHAFYQVGWKDYPDVENFPDMEYLNSLQ